ncbi:DUF5060 domain-containing protein [candidate division KSB1 bacterium]
MQADKKGDCPLFLIAVIVLSALVITNPAVSAASLKVIQTQNSGTVPLYEVFEITFEHHQTYDDPFQDVTIDVLFTSPSGKSFRVGGFHYGSADPPVISKRQVTTPRGQRQEVVYEFESRELWKARFAPAEPGRWRYSYVFSNLHGGRLEGAGSFVCVKDEAGEPNPGFLRLNPDNPFILKFDDGSPFFPVGTQDCWGDGSANGSTLDQCAMEGPFRTDMKEAPPLPAGPMFVRGPAENPQNGDVYFRLFGQCGFNLYRYSPENCSYPLNTDLGRYLVQESVMTDELLICARKYGFRILYGIFGFQKVFNQEPDNEEGMEQVKRFIKYSVDRWGAYVDIWELLNEQHAADGWYEITIPYLRSLDPYNHPVTTSWERPNLPGIDINAPHWYQNENELESDIETASRARKWKEQGLPVIVGEQGNRKKPPPPGVGGVWDSGSARRMRIRLWTAFFERISFVFWNTSYARDGHYMNIWFGPQEREYVRALQDFCYRLDGEIRPLAVETSHPGAVRAYGLTSEKRAGVYLHHYSDHDHPVADLQIELEVPGTAGGYWYSPKTAEILETVDLTPGVVKLDVPGFTIDIALLITPDGPPDIDMDGMPNNSDTDDDNDGVPDSGDIFPLDPSEWLDVDGDLIGDNFDADDDADGIGDDKDGDGTPDHEEFDYDGDGVRRSGTIPWDAFPLDPSEWRDTDGDGMGDNADTDDDGDGFSDVDEIKSGADPRDKLSFPAKP